MPRSMAAEKVPIAAPRRRAGARSTTSAMIAGCTAANASP